MEIRGVEHSQNVHAFGDAVRRALTTLSENDPHKVLIVADIISVSHARRDVCSALILESRDGGSSMLMKQSLSLPSLLAIQKHLHATHLNVMLNLASYNKHPRISSHLS